VSSLEDFKGKLCLFEKHRESLCEGFLLIPLSIIFFMGKNPIYSFYLIKDYINKQYRNAIY